MASYVILVLLLSSFVTIGRMETKNLFRRASEQYSACQKTMEATDKSYPKTQFAPFDELLDSYKKEEEEEKAEGEGISRTSRSTLSRR
uniref:Uncharacterized protein n=1 Tax=Heterorhabditis bacteriophora TaxID=37862 RepID=A0A1I7XFC2_HETBA